MYCRYNNVEDFISKLYRRKPLSCLMTVLNQYYVVIEESNKPPIKGMEIRPTFVADLPDLSMSFRKVSLFEQAADFSIDVVKQSDFFVYFTLA